MPLPSNYPSYPNNPIMPPQVGSAGLQNPVPIPSSRPPGPLSHPILSGPLSGATGPPPTGQRAPPPAGGMNRPLIPNGPPGPNSQPATSGPPGSILPHVPPGTNGPPGPLSNQGINGPPGAAKLNGPPGPPSNPGINGPPGPPGPPINLGTNGPPPVLPGLSGPPTTQYGSNATYSGTRFSPNPSGQYPTPNAFPQPPAMNSHASPNFDASNRQAGFPPSTMPPSSLNSGFPQPINANGRKQVWNLMQERQLISPEGIETPIPALPHDWKQVNCSPEIFRSTLNAVPATSSLLQKARLPLGVLIHPFKDLSQLPVIQSPSIVRCRTCRTYINPFVTFIDSRRWKCNLCFRVNDVPEGFYYDPVSRSHGDPQKRPEIQSATVEFIAPTEYMLRPPQPACYVFVLDVSFNAVRTGYLHTFCSTLLECLDNIPGDKRMQIGFLTFDRTVQFYELDGAEPKMMIVGDIDDIFLPTPESLMVNFRDDRKNAVREFLEKLPTMFEDNRETGSALGAALQAARMMIAAKGGRITVVQTILPSVGPGSLKCREDPNDRAGKEVKNLGPATDFYKSFALQCSEVQIAIDLFALASQYVDLATISGMAKYSGGCLHYYPGAHAQNNSAELERFDEDLRRYLTRKIGFEAVMRLRCTKGLAIHTFHGNFFVRSTDLLSLPNVNPDAGYGMQLAIEENLNELQTVSFQAALLYTSSKGERRIRVHTLCLPVANSIQEVFVNADQEAIIGLLSKMAVDKSLTSLSDARDAMINAVVDMLSSYASSVVGSKQPNTVACPDSLRLMPLFVLGLIKFTAFRVGVSTKLDERFAAMELCKTEPLQFLMLHLYPKFYPIHNLDKHLVSEGEETIPQPPAMHLSAAYLERTGAYILDAGSKIYLWLGSAIDQRFVQQVFGVESFNNVVDGLTALPEIESEYSELLRSFVDNLISSRPMSVTLQVVRDDGKGRAAFAQRLVEDRTEGALSYYEFLQYLQKEIK